MSRELFALDWIKGELLETLNGARHSLETFAETAGNSGRADPAVLAECVRGLHQVQGTLVMLEIGGLAQLAEHLERLADRLMDGSLGDEAAASQSLMQGILELPGYLEELQNGRADTAEAVRPLINELRAHLGGEPLTDGEFPVSLTGTADAASIRRFDAIDGMDKARKIRAVYQQVLLTVLKGGDVTRAVETLRKVAQGMRRVCEGTPLEAQWQAFGEFVESLDGVAGPLDGRAVKLLRRVDSEIRALSLEGSAVLQRPVALGLVNQMLDAAVAGGRDSPVLQQLRAASAGERSDALTLSGRQAMVSAATALREELATIKDRLDLFVRTGSSDIAEMNALLAPLKQIGSTLSLLAFESSKAVVAEQVDRLAAMVESQDFAEGALLEIAGALVQVDENLASLTQSGKGEVERITDAAEQAVSVEVRKGLDAVKQGIVDYVATQWDQRHLQLIPAEMGRIAGALRMIPLTRATDLILRADGYIQNELMAGHVPGWDELDRLADAISGLDYYLERLASPNPSGTEGILDLIEQSLDGLQSSASVPSFEPERFVPATEPVLEAPAFVPAADPVPVTEAVADPDSTASMPDPEALPPVREDADALTPILADPETDIPELETRASEDSVAPSRTEKTLTDDFESDPDIVEIFGEEVDEVLAAVDEQLPLWRASIGDENAQTEIRRAFHTLKGSGRMVGANVLGEMAWSVENMLNRLLEGTVAATPEFLGVVQQARDLAPTLRDAFERKQPGSMSAVAGIIEQADVLASGGSLADADDEDHHDAEYDPDAAEPGLPGEDHLLFLTEAEEHVAALTAAVSGSDYLLDDRALRALHTLTGSAAVGGLDAVNELAAPAYDLAQAILDARMPERQQGEIAEYFHALVDALRTTLADMRAGREPEAEFQLIAEADRLLMTAIRTGPDAAAARMDAAVLAADATASGQDAAVSGEDAAASREDAVASQEDAVASPEDTAASRPDAGAPEAEAIAAAGPGSLIAHDALEVILEVQPFLDNWLDGMPDRGFAARLSDALIEIRDTAEAGGYPAVALLAAALEGAHERCMPGMPRTLGDAAHQHLSRGYDRLLAHIDALATHQQLGPALDLVRALTELAPESMPEPGHAFDPESVPESGHTPGPEPVLESVAGPETAESPEPPVAVEPEADPAGPDDRYDPELAEPLHDEVSAEPPATVEARVDTPASGVSEPPVTEADPHDGLLPDEIDEDIMGVFFEEADEILEALDGSIHDWAREPDDRLHLENLLRGLHTLKGGARLSGLAQLGDVTHQFESVLIAAQETQRPVDAGLLDELHAGYDELVHLLARIRAALAGAPALPEVAPGDAASGNREETAPPVTWQPAIAPASTSSAASSATTEVPSGAAAAGAVDAERSAANVQPLRPAAQPSAKPAVSAKPAALPDTAVAEAATGSLDKRDVRPPQEMVRVGAALLENLVNLAGESSIIRARVEQGMSDFTASLDEMEITIDRLREQLRRLDIETEAQILFRQDRPDSPAYADFDPLEMDRYSQLQQLSRSLTESASDMLDLKETLLFKAREAETLLLQQARVNTELQEGLMRSRMVPFARLLPRLRRTVRQVAKELQKDVELHAFNIDGELDRTLLERMVPPLEHMLRNAVDHGIETPELRRSHGKAENGRIDLRLSREGGDVVIEISDDGAGIDVESVRAKAVERGLMAADAELRDDEISQFVLAPGFSTAKSVTQISGRGVGMDVVHSEVKQLGGSISIFSHQGRGTRFVLRVPFTVSVNRALMVSVGDDYYAIPLNNIEGIVLLSRDELDRLYAPDGKTFEYAGVPYRVRYLGNYLGREYHPQPQQNSVPVVLVRSGEQAVAVHVDGVQGSREIVVKSLGPQFAGVGGISGATILGDGSVVVILDLLALIRTRHQDLVVAKRGLSGAARTRTVMVVDDSVTVRKVTSRLLERQGMDVLVAKDGVEAIALLQERRPDVLLLDIEMPRMDGFEVLNQVRRDDRLHDLPVVMISSRTGIKHQERAAELGVSRFLGKPFQESELLSTIDELVN